ncbi:CFI-box-CTERM domain-containing protein [Argonema galeatum]|uniref:CFI-box-CTERM domain-containing protein n=1 Tax=Argonema galeatum TaxID=2942762 RepID=UPI002012B52C|nr:CFI-box-CTERM domain-containing protein [Argonema galeatum]MCL1467298.1 hypothetical protein [Argonema galeatum A003/A1]
MPENIYEIRDQLERDYIRLGERGKYYEEKGDHANALLNYLDSLLEYVRYISCRESALQVDLYIQNYGISQGLTRNKQAEIVYEKIKNDSSEVNNWLKISYSLEEQIKFMTGLIIRLLQISKQLESSQIEKAYVVSKIKQIFDFLTRDYQKRFDVEQLNFYQSLSDYLENNRYILTSNQEAIQKIKNTKIEIKSDEPLDSLKKIRVALSIASSTQISLTQLETEIQSLTKYGCFIATAAYSTPTHPDLDTFRNFRDEKLLTNPVGKRLVNFYYQISPSIAQYVEKQPAIKSFVRHQLERLAKRIRKDLI